MAHSININALGTPYVSERAPAGLWKLRLLCGGAILLATLVGLFALSWDIQWHTAVGRDRTLTAPHLFILVSATFMGLVALTAVLIETRWARRNTSVARNGTPFADSFSSSLGAYLVGYGALDTAISFPIDQYWHTLYGIDVTVWAPFHIMLLTGFCICCLGAAFLLIEGTQLATQQGARGLARVGYISTLVAFATLMGMFSILLPNALTTGYISLGGLTFTVYPLLLGAMAAFVLLLAIHALPGRPVATYVALIYALCGIISYFLVPPLMTWLLGVEQQSLLPDAPTTSVVAASWQYPLLIAAVLLDVVAGLAQRWAWMKRQINWLLFVAASLGISLAALFYPIFIRSQFLATAQQRSLTTISNDPKGIAPLRGIAPQHISSGSGPLNGTLNGTAVLIIVISLLLGLLGTGLGTWLGKGTGDRVGIKEQ